MLRTDEDPRADRRNHLAFHGRVLPGDNEGVAARLGGLSSARLILYSVNFEELKPATDATGWLRIGTALTGIAQRLESAGAECIVICANTPHKVADEVQRGIAIPILHIADAAGDAIIAAGLTTVGLLGTRPTMEDGFIRDRLAARGIATVVPDEASRAYIHASILEELGRGIFTASAKQRYLAIMDDLAERGARGIVLGCTEIPLLVRPGEHALRAFDTAAPHAAAAVEFVLR